MAGTILTTTNPSTVAIGHMKIISDTYGEKPLQYTQIFKDKQARQKTETIPHLGALGTWQTNNEGSPFNEDELVEGDTAQYALTIYNHSYDITYESIRWDQYDLLKDKAVNMGRGLRNSQEIAAAAIINNGFATTLGYDGSYLFSNTHDLASSASTGDNLTTGDLTDTNVKAAIIVLENTVNESNILIDCQPRVLWCGTGDQFVAQTILQSMGAAGELSNNKNVLPGMRLALMSRLTTGYWGVMDDEVAQLTFMWFDKPAFGKQDVPGTRNVKVWGYAAFTPGYHDWRGIVGSTG